MRWNFYIFHIIRLKLCLRYNERRLEYSENKLLIRRKFNLSHHFFSVYHLWYSLLIFFS